MAILSYCPNCLSWWGNLAACAIIAVVGVIVIMMIPFFCDSVMNWLDRQYLRRQIAREAREDAEYEEEQLRQGS